MDGLIVETESLQSKAYEQIIREHGKEPVFEENGLVHKVGIRGDEAWKIVLNKHQLTADIEKLREKKRSIVLQLLENDIKPMPGLIDLLDLLKRESIPIALGTGSTKAVATKILESLRIFHYFSVLVTGDEVKKGKPDPECFVRASERLGVLPQDCLVLEDAEPGVIAAKRIGMKVVAVPTLYTKDQDFSKADKMVDSLERVNWSMIASL